MERDERIKLCIHQRDFDVGETITGNIDKYLEKSWKVVVVMSNNFAQSEWCQWEVDVVQERRRRQGKDAFLLIMLKPIDSKNMTSPLHEIDNIHFIVGICTNIVDTTQASNSFSDNTNMDASTMKQISCKISNSNRNKVVDIFVNMSLKNQNVNA
ncbi:TLR6 [Mytilus coruscus]|uniref:TLR6 n=1 Tax=Mytilus coruscus TaxID=42192 RepID=A0A6J8BR97_MYTCO|nr:TLR6 [Mytilus coruscus]